MNHEQLVAEPTTMSHWQRHRFFLLVGGTIIISLMLVGVALGLYASSGAAQLDLSRPSYVSVREKVDPVDSFKGFPSSGALDNATLREFHDLYAERAKQATAIDGFGGEVMSDQALSIARPQ